MARREFTKAVRVEIVKRATRVNERGLSQVYCEGCGVLAKVWHVDHTIPDALQVDKSALLTAADGKVLCAGSPETCHGRKTPIDQRDIAKSKRNEASQHRIVRDTPKIRNAGFAKSPKAAARDARGRRPSLPIRLPRGFVPALDH